MQDVFQDDVKHHGQCKSVANNIPPLARIAARFQIGYFRECSVVHFFQPLTAPLSDQLSGDGGFLLATELNLNAPVARSGYFD